VTGFYSFIMLLWSRNHRKSSGQSLEPVGSEIFLAHRAYDYKKDLMDFCPLGHKTNIVNNI
jgi:hypothetical protein